VIKARVVRHVRSASLSAHLKYLQRDGVTRDDAPGKLFGPDGAEIDRDAFAERCRQDRHHFRFIVSPDDALEMADLREFTGALMTKAEKDLGTRLDWAAIDHWNTEHPHVHIIVRGVADNGQNLVISRDYIRQGMRGRAGELITRELGPKTELDIRRSLERQVEAERWTQIDRDLVRRQQRHGMIDMAPDPDARPDADLALKLGRLRKLERLALADQIKPGLWVIADNAEPALRELGMRGDIIKRMHRALQDRGIERGVSSYAVEAEAGQLIVGRLIERGLHDELTGSAYAIVDGIDGRIHHLTLPGIEETGNGRPGAIVELRRFEDRRGRTRMALAVRSDLDIAAQIEATGATWLDRRNLDRKRLDLGGGFGAEVADAMEARAQHLARQGLARREGQRIVFARGLLDTLNRRDLDAAGERMAKEFGRPYAPAKSGEFVAGSVRRQVQLASGRFAMIHNGLGFALVPWTPALDSQLGKHISGVMRRDGVDWSMGRGRGIAS
jgi:type IV secretory pathway VirD2 relaxase